MKQTLENFVNGVKQIGKNIVKHPIRYLFAFSIPFIATESLRAAEFLIQNLFSPFNPNVYNGIAYFQTFPDANEGGDSYDSPFLSAPYPNELEISSNEPGFRASTNAKRENTPHADFDLSLRNPLHIGYGDPNKNVLRIWTNDASGLENRRVIIYDINDPNNTVHDVNREPGALTRFVMYYFPPPIDLPAGKYATWRIETPALVPGDVAGPNGIGKLDGKFDYLDIKCICDEWLNETLEGQNYNWSDVNYDGLTNFKDFNIGAGSYNDPNAQSALTPKNNFADWMRFMNGESVKVA